jgi:hypothetical protein
MLNILHFAAPLLDPSTSLIPSDEMAGAISLATNASKQVWGNAVWLIVFK